MSPEEYEAKIARVERALAYMGTGAYRLYSNRDLARVFVSAVHEGEHVQSWQEAVRQSLSDTYDDAGVDIWLRNARPEWGGRSALSMILVGFGSTVLAKADALAGGPVVTSA